MFVYALEVIADAKLGGYQILPLKTTCEVAILGFPNKAESEFESQWVLLLKSS